LGKRIRTSLAVFLLRVGLGGFELRPAFTLGATVCWITILSFDVRPGAIDAAIAIWLQNHHGSALREKADKLSDAYRQGRSSSHIDLAAYLTVRMPATYAAVGQVLARVAAIAEGFAPLSILDVGAGPGTASWAAISQWADISQVTMVESDARFVTLAEELAKASELPALQHAAIQKKKLSEAASQSDLVIAAYVFAELEERAAGEAALKLWAQCEGVLVIIEPGTPRGFARIRNARAALVDAGAHIVGPCTHSNSCPMSGKDWCHFTQRLARSREHMHGKAATVPYEDEPFSWIAVSRQKYDLMTSRIVAPPVTSKIDVSLRVCSAAGLSTQKIASRDKQAYKLAKKLEWGDGH
jgi:ribosomal protein RSM22 (predicted rRNA methylase)